ncbi:MAG: GGDEF domain-containing protein [Pseudobutyrivibrio sp.]|nr:GGDEF domain-containing protein [Pseudobutyrivibrio sp.]
MYIITLTSTIVAILMTALFLVALLINKDNSETTLWIKRALWTNLVSLLIVCCTYTVSAIGKVGFYDTQMSVYRIGYILRDVTVFAVAPVCMFLVKYICALLEHKPEIDKLSEKVISYILAIGCFIAVIISGYIILRLLGIDNTTIGTNIYNVEAISIIIELLLVGIVVYAARKELGTLRVIPFIFYILCQIGARLVVNVIDESIYYTFQTMLLLFLLIAMQNEKLEKSKDTLERESSLLNEVAGIYVSVCVVDIENDTYRQIGNINPEIFKTPADYKGKHTQFLMNAIMRKLCNPNYLDEALRFYDFDTMSSRMRGKKNISIEIIDFKGQWQRFNLIRVGDDLEADINEVIICSENIDADKRERERLERVSFVDELTGAYSRNAFILRFAELSKSKIDEDTWIMFADVNGLKTANDRYGHKAGDALIVKSANMLMDVVKDYGKVYRNGGDEFIVLLKASEDEFNKINEEIDRRCLNEISEYTGAVMFAKGYVGAREIEGATIEQLAQEADRRMYINKKQFYATHSALDARGDYN